jgi:hypothetical protein
MGLRVGVGVGVRVKNVVVGALRVEECLRAAWVVLSARQVCALGFARGSVVAWVVGGQGRSVRHMTRAFGILGGMLVGESCSSRGWGAVRRGQGWSGYWRVGAIGEASKAWVRLCGVSQVAGAK